MEPISMDRGAIRFGNKTTKKNRVSLWKHEFDRDNSVASDCKNDSTQSERRRRTGLKIWICIMVWSIASMLSVLYLWVVSLAAAQHTLGTAAEKKRSRDWDSTHQYHCILHTIFFSDVYFYATMLLARRIVSYIQFSSLLMV